MYPPIEQFYDRATAETLVQGAAAAYGSDADMAGWAKAQGCDRCEVVRNERTDTLAFLAANEECGLVVFRGTTDLRNWITDLDCRLRIADCGVAGEVHAGIQGALDSVWERMAGLIGRMAAGRRDLFFAGHSLGGALAMLACARWTEGFSQGSKSEQPGAGPLSGLESRPAGWMYSFGQPRVGNAAWMRWYDGMLRSRSFRIVHSADVVARVPWLLGRYRHCGTEVFYDAAGVSHVDMPWWRKAGSDAAGLWREWQRGPAALLGDHHVNTYLEVLNGI